MADRRKLSGDGFVRSWAGLSTDAGLSDAGRRPKEVAPQVQEGCASGTHPQRRDGKRAERADASVAPPKRSLYNMASNASIPSRGLPPKPPDNGSFPLDHFRECSEAKESYMACLKENSMRADSDECRKLSASYLQCRMDA